MRSGHFSVGVAEYEVPDAFPVSFDPLFLQELFPLGAFKFFFGSVDPAAAEAQCGGGQHHVSEGQTAVVHPGGGGLAGKHDKNDRSAVEGSGTFTSSSVFSVG